MNIKKYIIDHKDLDNVRLLSTWKWLIGEDKEIMIVTKMGDLLLKDPSDVLYFLSTGEGSLEHVSNYSNDFFTNKLSAEQYFEIFQPELIEDLEQDGKELKKGQVYGFLTLPVMGGKNVATNITCREIYKHFKLTGEIHQQIDELPEGESLEIKMD